MKTNTINSKKLADGLKKGSSEELRYLYLKVKPKVEAYIVKNDGLSTDVNDIFQIALISVRNKLLDGNTIEFIESYLYKACQNEWAGTLRKNKKKRIADDSYVSHQSSNMGLPFEQLEGKGEDSYDQDMTKFLKAFVKLKPDCKKFFQLKSEKKSNIEIAKIMGVSVDFAKTKKTRCKKYFMDIYNNLKDYE